jgi:uncharacterized membrane protein (UPF0127 family)
MSKPTFLGPLVGKGAGRYELVNVERGSVLATRVEPAFDSATRRRGLLGRDSVPADYALIIAPCSSVHTFFMRFALDLVFVLRDGTVVKTCRAVKPWRIAGALRAFAVIEAASGFIDRAEIVAGDVVGLREIHYRRRATDVLPPLSASSTGDAGVPAVRHPDSLTPVTLAEIIARKKPIDWFESVAIVQELCATVLARGPTGDECVPELREIAVTPTGGAELLALGPAGHSPVRRACLVLLALTPEARLPLQLRLLALGGLAPTPHLTSLNELHKELEFFERPNRLDVVRGVYERFHAEPTPAFAGAAPPWAPLEPPPQARSQPAGPDRQWWRRKSVGDGMRIGVTALIVLAAIWQWEKPENQWLRTGAADMALAALNAGQKVVHAILGEVRRLTN